MRFITRLNIQSVHLPRRSEHLMIKSSLVGMRIFLNGSRMHFNWLTHLNKNARNSRHENLRKNETCYCSKNLIDFVDIDWGRSIHTLRENISLYIALKQWFKSHFSKLANFYQHAMEIISFFMPSHLSCSTNCDVINEPKWFIFLGLQSLFKRNSP